MMSFSPRPAARVRPLSDLLSALSVCTDRSARSSWLGLRAHHQPGKSNNAPGFQFCLRRLLFSSTSSSL